MIRPAGVRAWCAFTCLFLVAALSGCMDLPTSPETGGTGSTGGGGGGGGVVAPAAGPEVLKIGSGGTVGWVPMPTTYQGPSPASSAFTPMQVSEEDGTTGGTRSVSTTARVDGAKGGTVVCGRFVATIPAGAFEGVGDITMTMPDATLMICNLEITPSELNGFAVPVELSLHTDGTEVDLDSLEIYWWDPAKSDWTAMAAQKSTTLEPVLMEEAQSSEPVSGVRLQLNHFSTYAGGKAGW